MISDPRLSELLETIVAVEARNEPVRLAYLAEKLSCSRDRAEKILEIAFKEGLVEYVDNALRLTSRGRMQVRRHREEYIHDKYAHKPGFWGRMARFFEGSVQDWHGHWHRRHGLDETSLRGFYSSIRDLEGRVEETFSLADLPQGERGVVAFALGGYGLVRRLAEMGLTPGTEVRVVRCAPFHGPIEISVRGVSLALGRGVASKIFLRRTAEGN
jgi:Fe2+ transport system protein FeoA